MSAENDLLRFQFPSGLADRRGFASHLGRKTTGACPSLRPESLPHHHAETEGKGEAMSGENTTATAPLDPAEWDFSSVPAAELPACFLWEYARENTWIRKLRERCLLFERGGNGL